MKIFNNPDNYSGITRTTLTIIGFSLVIYAIGWIAALGILFIIISVNLGILINSKDPFDGFSNPN
jgi:hypothetical protein